MTYKEKRFKSYSSAGHEVQGLVDTSGEAVQGTW
jgi:hypothetical protein